ncbi:MAG: MFS transporter [Saprospiraceae bacterium]|jgi:UMF1 family MFS transporter|nr:MFS transporter [Saprospiraceae bacterium]
MTETKPAFQLNDPKVIKGWAMFDWANSAYSLTIAVAIFPAFFEAITAREVAPWGISMYNTTLFSLIVGLSYLLIAAVSPILSGIADSSGRRLAFMRFFTTVGSLACMSLFFFDGKNLESGPMLSLGIFGFLIATAGFGGSIVFYNSYLPDIVTEENYNRVSARGFMMGYVGSVILLIINLLVITYPGWFGLSPDGTLAVRLSFLMVGLWWMGFAQYAFRRLPPDGKKPITWKLVKEEGYEEFAGVWRTAKQLPNLKRFLLSFFFYSAGVQTVISLASLFASSEMEMESSELILVILLLQILALVGAWCFAKLSDAIGNKSGLVIMLVLWTVVCVFGYFVEGKVQFYLMAAAVGLVMGGVQSQSRATYSKLLPPGTKDTTSYFSFYDVLEKAATALGSFSFALTGQISGGLRVAVLVLGGFFLIGLVILLRVKIARENKLAV